MGFGLENQNQQKLHQQGHSGSIIGYHGDNGPMNGIISLFLKGSSWNFKGFNHQQMDDIYHGLMWEKPYHVYHPFDHLGMVFFYFLAPIKMVIFLGDGALIIHCFTNRKPSTEADLLAGLGWLFQRHRKVVKYWTGWW